MSESCNKGPGAPAHSVANLNVIKHNLRRRKLEIKNWKNVPSWVVTVCLVGSSGLKLLRRRAPERFAVNEACRLQPEDACEPGFV